MTYQNAHDRKTHKRLLLLFITVCLSMLMGMTAFAASPSLNKKKVTLTTGKAVRLKVRRGKASGWASSNPKVARVTKTGKVLAISEGKAKITVRAGKKRLSCKVTVNLKSFTANVKKVTLAPGQSYRLYGIGDGKKVSATFKSSSKKKVSVGKRNGIIKAKKTGSAKITITHGKKKYTVKVIVKKRAALSVVKTRQQIQLEQSAVAKPVRITFPNSTASTSQTTPAGTGRTGTQTNSGSGAATPSQPSNPSTPKETESQGSGTNSGSQTGGQTGSQTEEQTGDQTGDQTDPKPEKNYKYYFDNSLAARKAYDYQIADSCDFFRNDLTNQEKLQNLNDWIATHVYYNKKSTWESRYADAPNLSFFSDIVSLNLIDADGKPKKTDGMDCIGSAQTMIAFAHYFLGLKGTIFYADPSQRTTHMAGAIYLPAETIGNKTVTEGWYGCEPFYKQRDGSYGGKSWVGQLTAKDSGILWTNLMKMAYRADNEDNPDYDMGYGWTVAEELAAHSTNSYYNTHR